MAPLIHRLRGPPSPEGEGLVRGGFAGVRRLDWVRAARAAEGVGPYGASAKTGCRAGTCAPPSRVPECGGPRVAALRQVIIKCGDNGAPHPPLARSPFPRGGRFWCGGMQVHTFVYICIPNTTTTPAQTQTIPSPDPDPDANPSSNPQTHPSSQPERKRRGVVESVENCAVRLFHGLNALFFTFSTN